MSKQEKQISKKITQKDTAKTKATKTTIIKAKATKTAKSKTATKKSTTKTKSTKKTSAAKSKKMAAAKSKAAPKPKTSAAPKRKTVTSPKPKRAASSKKTVINPEAIMYYQDLTPGEPKKSPFLDTQLTPYKQHPKVQAYIQQHSKANLYINERPTIPRTKKVAGWNEDVPYVLSRETSQELPSFTFVGRQNIFELLEDQRASARHTALIGMRKMGKTTFLKRYYDYLFCTSNEVIPFFYSLMNLDEKRGSKRSVVKVAEEMMVIFLSQALGFLTQNKYLANNNSFKELLAALEELRPEAKERFYEPFHQLIEDWYADGILHPLYTMMQRSLDLTIAMKRRFDLSPVIMLDEYQEIGRSLVDENGEPYDCVPILNKYHCNEKIFLVLSGSGLTTRMEEALPSAFEYRIEKIHFGPLEKEESKELMRRTIQALKIQGFTGIEDILYEWVDGNPYFMRSVFAKNLAYEKAYGQKKEFTNKLGLERAYEFECKNATGKIYDFWHWYLVRNWRAYPTFIKFGKDIYQILEFLVNRKEKAVPFVQLQDFMKKNVEELIPMLLHLERIDLIEWNHTSNVIFITKEPTIIASIRAIEYPLFYPDDPEEIHREENLHKHIQEILRRLESMEEEKADMADQIHDIKANVHDVQANVHDVQTDVEKMHDAIMSLRGSLNYEKGMEAEAVIRGRIQRMEGLFTVYPVVGDVRNQKILDPISKKGYELDCVCDLDPAQLPLSGLPVAKIDYTSVDIASNSVETAQPSPKCKGMLVVEVKTLKQKISLAQAQHFIKGLQALQRLYGLTQIYAMYHAPQGFAKTAADSLMQHNIMVVEYAEEAKAEG